LFKPSRIINFSRCSRWCTKQCLDGACSELDDDNDADDDDGNDDSQLDDILDQDFNWSLEVAKRRKRWKLREQELRAAAAATAALKTSSSRVNSPMESIMGTRRPLLPQQQSSEQESALEVSVLSILFIIII
jgi:hypothetical protein